MKRLYLINSATVFIATLIVIPAICLLVYFNGLEQHRSLYLNSLISTTLLSVIFLSFITAGLYRGWKLKDTIGDFEKRFSRKKRTPKKDNGGSVWDFFQIGIPEGADSLEDIVAWILVGIVAVLLFWLVAGMIWATLFMLAAVLYWVIFRAYRLVFKNSARSKGDMTKSFLTALLYTFLYNCWIYAIIFGVHFLEKYMLQK